jgi:hypothetical protein
VNGGIFHEAIHDHTTAELRLPAISSTHYYATRKALPNGVYWLLKMRQRSYVKTRTSLEVQPTLTKIPMYD